MDRRNFLKLLASGSLGYALDVDKLLWVPGAKKIFLPSPSFDRPITLEMLTKAMQNIILQAHPGLFERDDIFYNNVIRRVIREVKCPYQTHKLYSPV